MREAAARMTSTHNAKPGWEASGRASPATTGPQKRELQMPQSITPKRDETDDAEMNQKMDAFARAITDLCATHGLGVEGGTLYVMENDDYHFSYSVDAEGSLIRI